MLLVGLFSVYMHEQSKFNVDCACFKRQSEYGLKANCVCVYVGGGGGIT